VPKSAMLQNARRSRFPVFRTSFHNKGPGRQKLSGNSIFRSRDVEGTESNRLQQHGLDDLLNGEIMTRGPGLALIATLAFALLKGKAEASPVMIGGLCTRFQNRQCRKRGLLQSSS